MIAAWFAAQYSNIAKWLGYTALIVGAFFYVRKSGKDAERVVSATAEKERTEAELNEIKRHQQIIHDNARLTSDDTNKRLRSDEF